MAQGLVKTLTDRGFGFISSDSGDIFFHMSTVEGTHFEALQEGQAVEYETESGPKGPRATVVRIASGGGESAADDGGQDYAGDVDDGGSDAGDDGGSDAGDDGGSDAGDDGGSDA
ncbi:MAG: cold shock domain-containing protein, partial [Planctomycetaceae bacterium]